MHFSCSPHGMLSGLREVCSTAQKKETEHLLLLIPIQECTKQILALSTWHAQRVARGLFTQLIKKKESTFFYSFPFKSAHSKFWHPPHGVLRGLREVYLHSSKKKKRSTFFYSHLFKSVQSKIWHSPHGVLRGLREVCLHSSQRNAFSAFSCSLRFFFSLQHTNGLHTLLLNFLKRRQVASQSLNFIQSPILSAFQKINWKRSTGVSDSTARSTGVSDNTARSTARSTGVSDSTARSTGVSDTTA